MRRPVVLSVLSALSLVGLGAPPTVAQADVRPLLQCTGDTHTTYSPGLTNGDPQPTDVMVTKRFGTEANPVGTCLVVGAPITGGHHSHQRVLPFSCQVLLLSTPVIETYTWDNGATSTANFTTSRYTQANGETVIIRTGTVTSGFAAGDTAQQTVTLLNSDLAACDSPTGLTSISGVVALTFL